MVNLKELTDSDLMKLRDDVSNEIMLRCIKLTPDEMVGLDMEKAALFLSFDFFNLEQCLIIARKVLKTIKQKEKNDADRN